MSNSSSSSSSSNRSSSSSSNSSSSSSSVVEVAVVVVVVVVVVLGLFSNNVQSKITKYCIITYTHEWNQMMHCWKLKLIELAIVLSIVYRETGNVQAMAMPWRAGGKIYKKKIWWYIFCNEKTKRFVFSPLLIFCQLSFQRNKRSCFFFLDGIQTHESRMILVNQNSKSFSDPPPLTNNKSRPQFYTNTTNVWIKLSMSENLSKNERHWKTHYIYWKSY